MEALRHEKVLIQELHSRKQEFKEIVVYGIGQGRIPSNQESFEIVVEEAVRCKQIVEHLEEELGSLRRQC